MPSLLLSVFIASGVTAIVTFALFRYAWKRRNIGASFVAFLLTIIFLLTGAAASLVKVGMTGYRALVQEMPVATVEIAPLGVQQFSARIRVPHRKDTTFALAGDQLYVDARILKWKPLVNIIGVHAAYQLDRVAGRYASIEDERIKVRTVHSLAGPMRPWDLFSLRKRFLFLAPIVDAQYGSATFVPAHKSGHVEILVTASGLIARPVAQPNN